MPQKSYPGVNIQWPISDLILSGEKIVETRTYPIPDKYLNKEMVLVETPGPRGKFEARTRAIIVFTDCFQYRNKKEFHADFERHKVEIGSIWDWKEKPKWGWAISVKQFTKQQPVRNKGIKFTRSILI